MFGLNWDRCLFSCRHFEIIFDLQVRGVYCDAWVIIAIFSRRQSKHLFDILLLVGSNLITSQVMLGVIFLFFNFQMYADRVVLFEYLFKFENESLLIKSIYVLFRTHTHVCVCVCVCVFYIFFYYNGLQ